MQRLMTLSAFIFALCAGAAPFPKAPTFQDLLSPDSFPDPQRGMQVTAVTASESRIEVQTTGAEIALDLATGIIDFRQRIGTRRLLASVSLGMPVQGAKVIQRGSGFAMITVEKPPLTIRINGDSLTMIQPHADLSLPITRQIIPGWFSSFRGNHLVADELGAFGLYCSNAQVEDHFDAYQETVATYPLISEDVLWVAVCPPKPYPWKQSLTDHVVWHWTRGQAYPSDEKIAEWANYGNTVLLQSEVKLWKDWNLAFEPREGRAEFARVRETMHRQGLRFIVYTSPFYFLKKTALEYRALNSFEGFKGWPPGTPTGENMQLFLTEIRKVMQELRPDGLYFDGQYTNNPAALYALAREARQIVGPDGILEWHSTRALGSDLCSLPQADAYVDMVLRGEGRQSRYGDADYLRFFVSSYNISNSIGVLCNNMGGPIEKSFIEQILDVNCRLHTIVSWLPHAEVMTSLQENYFPQLNDALRQRVDAGVQRRQAALAGKIASIQAEKDRLKQAVTLTNPVLEERFSALPSDKALISDQNPTPFTVTADGLQIRAHAHTYAFFERELPPNAAIRALVLRVRHGTDGGMSWGPAAALQFDGGGFLRLGTRSDGTLQADVNGRQLYGYGIDTVNWIWVRARWSENFGVIECSSNGEHYQHVWSFEHSGVCAKPAKVLLFGKVPFDGKPHDHREAGTLGECALGKIALYGP